MKAKSFKLNVPTPKQRKHFAPVEKVHRDKRNSYNRQAFKRGGDGYEL